MASRRDFDWHREGTSNGNVEGLDCQCGGTLNGSAKKPQLAARRDLDWQHGGTNGSAEARGTSINSLEGLQIALKISPFSHQWFLFPKYCHPPFL